jgi:adenylate cyclase
MLTRYRLTRQDLRLGSGLILFAYVAAHFTNHALGLISVAAAERGLRVAVAIWHTLPGTVLLYGAAGIHITLAFVALYEHRTMRMPPMELLRIVLGFGIPTLLIAHAVTTRLAFEAYGAQPSYARIVWMLWHSNHECRQLALLAPGWLHGCLGLNFAFGRRAWFQRMRLILFGAALLLPILATLGFLAMLKEVSILAQDPAWFNTNVLSLDAGQTDNLAQTSSGWFATLSRSFGESWFRSPIPDAPCACRVAGPYSRRAEATIFHIFPCAVGAPDAPPAACASSPAAISAPHPHRMNSTPSTEFALPTARGSHANCDRWATSA